jgi:Fe(3+) dicitrate transport protein
MKRRTNPRRHAAACLAAGLSATAAVSAQDALQPLQTLAPLTVVGSAENAFHLPGSAAYLDAVEFRSRGYTNLRQIAARVPGVYVRDEDGWGNFPNISIRGVDGSRSQKVTMMEDGILTAPSPYAAPAAYYSPKSGRMAGIEFLKGSSQVRYGPQTTGGVVNFLSTPIPEDGHRFYSRTTFGSDDTFFNHTWYGDVQETQAGRIGYLLEFHGQTTDGFRNIENSGRDTGFDLLEPMLKLFWEPNTALKQRIEFKAGFTDFEANESYTGITEADLRRNPDRRYAGTKFDHMDSEHWRSYGKWIAEPSDAVRIESALYFNSFRRNWNKVESLSGTTRTNVGEALMDPAATAVLRGFGSGRVIYRDAFRDHESYGWQNQVNIRFATGQLEHDLAVGGRLHYDRAGGTNQSTTYTSNSTGGFGTGTLGAKTFAGLGEVLATAAYVEDTIKVGRLSVRPGIRYEWLEWDDRTAAAGHADGDENLLMGGVGATYDLTDTCSLFGGIYRGASPSNPSGYRAGTESEESTGLELGFRHRAEATRWELVGFFTEFSDLIAPEVGVGGGGLTPNKNGGGAESWGFEALVSHDLAHNSGGGFGVPVYASATYTSAEFKGIRGSRLGNSAGLFAGARNGNEVPYIPQWKLAAGIGFTKEKWGVNLDVTFNSDMWGTGYNGDPRRNDTTGAIGNQSAIDGKIDSLLLFDLSGHYQLTENVRLVGGIQNLFDEREIISRAPLGPRSNSPRMIFAGLETTF